MSPTDRKDPTGAFLLAICLPGSGHVYAGAVAIGVLLGVLIVAAWVVAGFDSIATLVPVSAQVLTAFHASKLANQWNRAHGVTPLPPPPPPSMTAPRPGDPAWASAPPPPPPPPPPPAPAAATGPVLDPDAFLTEIRSLWQQRRSGAIDGIEYDRRKADAINRVRVTDLEDGYALLEAASALVASGVLTADDRGRLQRQAAAR